jgi:hypothetical protein
MAYRKKKITGVEDYTKFKDDIRRNVSAHEKPKIKALLDKIKKEEEKKNLRSVYIKEIKATILIDRKKDVDKTVKDYLKKVL